MQEPRGLTESLVAAFPMLYQYTVVNFVTLTRWGTSLKLGNSLQEYLLPWRKFDALGHLYTDRLKLFLIF